MKITPTLAILGLIMLINALSYGTIIPLMYPFAARFGLNPLGLSILFALYSLAQLIATPVIGRLSDFYGRKPLLLGCLAGTAVSLALFASAQSILLLFVARILDGITGGNNSVAQAMVADTTTGKERGSAFALLGATMGVGFLIGPALGGILSQISLTAPFWFGSILAGVGTIAGFLILPETRSKAQIQTSLDHQQLSIFSPKILTQALMHPITGPLLGISLLYAIAQNAWVIGFQSFTVDQLKLTTTTIGLLFASFGLVTIIMQSVGVPFIFRRIKDKRQIVIWALLLSALTMIPTAVSVRFVPFFISITLYAIVSSPIIAALTTLISEKTHKEDQGGILGINQSLISVGQILGPLTAGVVTTFSTPLVFVLTASLFVVTAARSRRIVRSSTTLDLK